MVLGLALRLAAAPSGAFGVFWESQPKFSTTPFHQTSRGTMTSIFSGTDAPPPTQARLGDSNFSHFCPAPAPGTTFGDALGSLGITLAPGAGIDFQQRLPADAFPWRICPFPEGGLRQLGIGPNTPLGLADVLAVLLDDAAARREGGFRFPDILLPQEQLLLSRRNLLSVEEVVALDAPFVVLVHPSAT